MANQQNDYVWALAGAGTRRWGLLDRHQAPPNSAAALAKHKAIELRTFRLDDRGMDHSAGAILQALQADVARGKAAVGWIGYEVGAALESVSSHGEPHLPDAAWWTCDPAAIEIVPLPAVAEPTGRRLPPQLHRQRSRYVATVRDLVERIAAGEVYQVNLTVAAKLPVTRRAQPLEMVSALTAAQPVPLAWAMSLDGGEGAEYINQYPNVTVGCGSMERFLRVQGDRVSTRPIKGTAKRNANPDRDAQLAAQLQTSPKERAENTMIVDMARNDLQRACRPLTVTVDELLSTQAYETLWHLESEVSGQLRSGSLADLLQATLPPASVTGCPKVQAMRVIAQLERRRREVYCGTVFCALPDGTADFAVAIRTLVLDAATARIAVGSGIVADSVPAAEWRETCRKAQSGLRALACLQDPQNA
ncbi:MAG: anthranilate synthase component I family protein [Myxococcales bacterium]|nr:anthranilate synthase component I family protein [Myxococcales bacterium]